MIVLQIPQLSQKTDQRAANKRGETSNPFFLLLLLKTRYSTIFFGSLLSHKDKKNSCGEMQNLSSSHLFEPDDQVGLFTWCHEDLMSIPETKSCTWIVTER